MSENHTCANCKHLLLLYRGPFLCSTNGTKYFPYCDKNPDNLALIPEKYDDLHCEYWKPKEKDQ